MRLVVTILIAVAVTASPAAANQPAGELFAASSTGHFAFNVPAGRFGPSQTIARDRGIGGFLDPPAFLVLPRGLFFVDAQASTRPVTLP